MAVNLPEPEGEAPRAREVYVLNNRAIAAIYS